MVDERIIISIWLIPHKLECCRNLGLDFVVVGDIFQFDLAFLHERKLKGGVQIIQQLLTCARLNFEIGGNIASEDSCLQGFDVTPCGSSCRLGMMIWA